MWSCICTRFYMHTVPGVGDLELQSIETVWPPLDRRQQGRILYIQLIVTSSLCLWAYSTQYLLGLGLLNNRHSKTCTNLSNKHTFPIQRKSPTVWIIFTVVQKDQSSRVPLFPYNFSFKYFCSGLYFNCNLIHLSSGVKNHLLISQPWWHYSMWGTSIADVWI